MKRFRGHLLVLFGLIMPCLAPQAALAQTEEQYRIKSETKSPATAAVKNVTAEAHYKQSPEVVWKLLNKLEDLPSFIPRLKAIESLGISDGKERVYIMVDTPWPIPDIWNILTVTRDAPAHRLNWEMTQGNIKKNVGYYSIEPEGTGSVARLQMTADLGLAIPKWLVGWGVKRFLPKLFVAIGQRLDKGVNVLPITVASENPAAITGK